MIDITEARALVETLKDYAEHPSSFTDISPTEADAAADLIDALLDEVERLNSPVVLSEWQKLVAERDALARDAARYREFVVSGGWHRHIDGEHPEESYSYLLVGLPVDADLSSYAARKLAMDKVLDEGSER